LNLIVVADNEIISSDGHKAYDSIQEAIAADCPLFIHAPYYVELLKKQSDLLPSLEGSRASVVFPLNQDSSFTAFAKLLNERNWTENGVLRMKRSKTASSQPILGHLVSDLYMIQQSISPIARISGVSISHEPSKTEHRIVTIRFSNKSMGHYEYLSSPHVSEDLDLEWSGRDGILEYESHYAKAFKSKFNEPSSKNLRVENSFEITTELNEELQKLLTIMDHDIKHEVRR
jgi:hypothetical protein